MSLLTTASQWRNQGARVAIATVIKTWGSAPRPAGSMLIVREDGQFEGSVSGGCVEGAVIAEAKEVLATGTPKRLTFGVADETAWSIGLACGGQIEIFLEAVD